MIQNFATLQHREIFVPILLQGMLEMIHDSLPQTQDVTPSILCLWPTFAFPLGVPWMQTSFLMGKIRFETQLKKLNGLDTFGSLADLQKQMNEVQTVLCAVQNSLSFQSSVLTEMRSCMTIDTRDRRGKTHKAGDFAVPQGPSERTEVAAIDMDGLAAPSDEPPVLSVIPVPGEICTPRRMSEDKSSGAVTVNKKSSTVRSVQSEQDKPKCLTLHSGQRGLPKRHVFTMEEVEAQTHTALLARSQPELDISGSFTQKQGAASSVSIVDPVAEESASLSSESRNSDNEAEVVLGSNEQLDPNKSSQQILRSSLSRYPPEGGKKVLQMCRRMSLDDLRLNHDAVIATTQRTETNTRGALTGESLISSSSSFCRCAKLWLAVVGIMNFPDLRPGCALFCMSVVLLVLVGALVSLTSMGLSDPYISATTLCYLVGVLAAAWRLRW